MSGKLEEKLKKLEQIAQIIDNDEIDLEKMIDLYKEGMQLVAESKSIVESQEQKVKFIDEKYG